MISDFVTHERLIASAFGECRGDCGSGAGGGDDVEVASGGLDSFSLREESDVRFGDVVADRVDVEASSIVLGGERDRAILLGCRLRPTQARGPEPLAGRPLRPPAGATALGRSPSHRLALLAVNSRRPETCYEPETTAANSTGRESHRDAILCHALSFKFDRLGTRASRDKAYDVGVR